MLVRRVVACALSVVIALPATATAARAADGTGDGSASAPAAPTGVPGPLPPMADPRSGVGTVTAAPSAPHEPWHDEAPETLPSEWYTPSSHHVRNADGTVTATIHNGPAFTRDRIGSWKRTKPTLAASSARDWALTASESYRPVHFGRSAERLLALDLPGGEVVMSAAGLAIGSPSVRRGKPHYANVATDTDLVFEPGAGGVKQLLVLRSARSPRTFRFHLADPDGVLGDVQRQDDGGYVFSRSIGDGVQVGLAPAVAYEQPEKESDDPVNAEKGSAHLTVTAVPGGFDVVESVDEEWLAGKRFPIVLDPTVKYFEGSGHLDCYVVSDNYSDQGNCNAGSMLAGNGLGGTPLGTCGTGTPKWCITRSLMKFDVSAMPRGSNVTAASLKLWQFDNQNGANFNIGLYNNDHWFTSAATWDQYDTNCAEPCWAGGDVGTGQGTIAVTASDAFRTWNLNYPNIVETWRNNLSIVGGLMVRANPEARSSIGTTGHVVGFYSNTVADSTKWPEFKVTYEPPAAPVVSKTVAPAPGYTTSPNGSYARGTVARYTVTTTSPIVQANVILKDTVPAGVTVLPETITVDGVACPTCLAGSVLTKNDLDFVTTNVHTLRYDAVLTGTDERDCMNAVNSATATAEGGRTHTDTATVAICDSGLGLESWWQYFTRPVAYQSAAFVNAANGNVVVQQQDATTIQGRGRIALGLRRTYNSQDTRVVNLPGGIGENWQLNFGEVSDNGVSPSGLVVPPLTTLSKTLPVTLVDDDGTRHVFKAKTWASSLQVMQRTGTSPQWAIAPVTSSLGSLVPNVLGGAVDLGKFNAVCLDVAYTAPAGVHLGLWRYVALNNTGASGPCVSGTASGIAPPVLLGYATQRTDRLRSEFSWDGKLLSQTDTTGNALRFAYAGGLPLATSTALLGRLETVYEPGECTLAQAGSTTSSCRAFRLAYGASNVVTSIVDPAGRTTSYEYDTSFGFPQLTRVVNPDASAVAYTYYDGDAGTCTVTGQVPQRGQLCSITDERGTKTRIRYNSSLSGQPGRAHSIVDNRGTTTTFTYASDGSTTDALVNGQQKRSWRLLDSRGRPGQVVDSVGTTTYHQTDLTWDSAGCRLPSGGSDNNLCRVVGTAFNDGQTNATNGIDTPNSDASFYYNDEGALLKESKVDTARLTSPATTSVTTYGYRSLHTQRTTTTTADDTVSGGGNVAPGARPAAANVVYTLSDRTQALNAAGNSSTTWQPYLMTYRVENATAAAPNTAPPPPASPDDPRDAVICTQPDLSIPVTNTGLVCEVEAPWTSTGRSLTRYEYDSHGARRTATTPEAIREAAETETEPLSTTYTYYDSGTTDLSGGTRAAGWLKGVTDPYGHFVTFGYDRAGNVVRTWDRNATARGLAVSSANDLDSYPASGGTDFSESRFGPYAFAPTGATPYSAPWRHLLLSADQLGNTTTFGVDAHGNRERTTPPRGTRAGTTNYDTVQEFTPAGDVRWRMTPEGKDAGDKKYRWGYDAYGNVEWASTPLAHPDFPDVRPDDPNGQTKKYVYDGVNRLSKVMWTRTGTAGQAAGGCSTTGGTAPLASGRYLCEESYTYDGLDNPVTTKDADEQVTHAHFDAARREVKKVAPGPSGVALITSRTHDRAGRVTSVCTPRQFPDPASDGVCPEAPDHGTAFTYGIDGHAASSTVRRDGTPIVTSWEYDADGAMVREELPANGLREYAFDLLGRRTTATETRDGVEHATGFTYDPSGNTLSVTRPGGVVTAYSYDKANRPTDAVQGADSTDAAAAGATPSDGGANIRSSVRYDADGNVVARIEPRAFRDALGLPATTVGTTTPFMTRYDIDLDGRTVATFQARFDGSNAFGDLSTSSAQGAHCTTGNRPTPVFGSPSAPPAYPNDAAVCVTKVAYDLLGNKTVARFGTSSGTDNRYLGFTYTDDNLLATSTAPDPADPSGSGRVVAQTNVYDGEGRLLHETRATPAGGTPYVTTSSYSPNGLLLQRTDGTAANVTDNTYDLDGNLSTTKDALLRTTEYEYTSDGLLTSITDPNLKVTSYTYDDAGRPETVVSPKLQGMGRSVRNTYSTDGLLLTTTEPVKAGEDRRTTYGYDVAGRKTSVASDVVDANGAVIASGGAQAFAYYASGRLASETGRGGTDTTTYAYDAAGAPTTVTAAATGEPAVDTNVTWYLDGRVRTVAQSGRTTSYAHDGSGALVLRDEDHGSHTLSQYGYGNGGQLATVTSGRLPSGGSIGYGYDSAGRLTSRTHPNATTLTRTYRTDNLLSTQVLAPTSNPSAPLASYRYDYDTVQRVTLAARDAGAGATCPAQTPVTLPAGGVQCFYYDQAGRLSDFRDDSGDKPVTYDANGNREAFGTHTFTYNLDNTIATATTAAGTESYDYDAAGRLAWDGATRHCYDGMDRLAEVRPDASGCSGALTEGASYSYDAFDRQVSRTEVGSNAVTPGTTGIHYDGLAETLLAEELPTSTTSYVTAGGSAEYVTSSTGSAQYLTQDGRGNVVTAVTQTPSLACKVRFDPFGSPLGAQGQGNPCSTGSTLSSVLFGGARRDAATGNYQAGGRTYAPGKAGFLTGDSYRAGSAAQNLSIGTDPMTANRYSYVNGDPVNYGDPDGHEPKLINGSWTGFGCADGICSMAAVYARDVDRIERSKHANQIGSNKPPPACKGFLGCVKHIGSSFVQGAKDGTMAMGEGFVALGELAVSNVTLPGRVAVALSEGDTDAAMGHIRAHGTKVKDAATGMVNGLVASAEATNPVAMVFNTISNVRKYGVGDGLARTAYAQGQLVPEAVLTVATMGAGKGLSKIRAGRASAPSAARGTLHGSGPVAGVLEVSDRVKSVAAFRNYTPKGAVEYVYDPANGRFAVGRPKSHAGLKGSPHQKLAESIGADPSEVVGGMLRRQPNGGFVTDEISGHFHQNWTPEVRSQFRDFMEGFGLDVSH